MKNFFAFCLMSFFLAAPINAAENKTEIGIILATPEIFGGYVSYYPLNELSLDTWVTLSTIDAGLTGLVPFAHAYGTHNFLLTGMAGYAHDLVRAYPYRGFHSVFAAGYGYETLGGWDFRVELGLNIVPQSPAGIMAPSFHSHLMLGHQF